MSNLPPRVLWGRRAAGLLAVVVGGTLTATSLALMNGNLIARPDSDPGTAVVFDAAPASKPPPARPKPKPKPKPRKTSAAPPVPLLAAGLGGLSFGLPGLDGALADATSDLIGDVGDVVMTEDAVDDPPRPVSTVAPEYPVRARAKGVSGFVTLSLLVGADGSLQDVRVLEARPAGVFDQAAMDAVRQWRFQPAMYEGRPVSMRARQTLRFELE